MATARVPNTMHKWYLKHVHRKKKQCTAIQSKELKLEITTLSRLNVIVSSILSTGKLGDFQPETSRSQQDQSNYSLQLYN